MVFSRSKGESERLDALRAYEVLGTPPEEGFDRISRLAARVLKVPVAIVSLITEDRMWLKSCVGLPGVEAVDRDIAFCGRTISQDEALVVPDASRDPRFENNPLVTGPPHIRFYLGVPLRTPSGHNVGSLCAVDFEPREVSEDDLRTMRELAAVVVDEFELRKSLRESEAHRARVAAAEENYRHLAESIQGMVFQASQKDSGGFEFEYVSLGSLEIFGLLPEQIAVGQDALFRLFHPDDVQGVVQAIARSATTGKPFFWEARVGAGEQREKWVRILARPSTLPSGTVHWRGVMVDVTEARDRERALAEAKEAADRASRSKGDFFSRMSHELRTPLNAILGFTQTLAIEPLSIEAQADIEEIERAGRHLLQLINEILDLATLDARSKAIEPGPVAVCETLTEVYGLLRPIFEAGNVGLRVVHRCDGAYILADKGQLKQIIINIITNAIKYNKHGGCVHVSAGKDRDGAVSIAVADEGEGIRADRIPRLFTPFDRLGAEARGIEGTGLDLAITHGIVSALGGTISVASVPGQGSTFTISLPSIEAAAVAA